MANPRTGSRDFVRTPIIFAGLCGMAIATIGVSTQGVTFGSGYAYTWTRLEGTEHTSLLYVVLKFMAIWLTSWPGVPGRIFAPSLTLRSDQGCQFTSHEWQNFLKSHNLVASMNRRGNGHDNAVLESFFHLLKRERIRRRSYAIRDLARDVSSTT